MRRAGELDRNGISKEFKRLVNMSATELHRWLETSESRSVGWKKEPGAESIGHASGRRIAVILGTPNHMLDDEDYLQMRRTIGFVRRHLAQEPANVVTSRWRWSLMNWGHDPLKSA